MRRSLRALSAAALVALLTALWLPSASAADDGMIRLAHLSPDTPSVDVYVHNVADPGPRITLASVGYGAVSDYRSVPPGTYAVSFRPAGADPASPPVLSTTVDIRPGTARTVAGVGFFADLTLAILDDLLSLPPAGTARVRVISAAGSAPSMDVSAGGQPLASDLAFGTAGDYVEAPAGRGMLQVTPQGGSPARLPVTVETGAVHSLLVLDRDGGGLTVRPVRDASSTGVVPVGGVETGAGGTAGGSRTVPAVVAALAGLALLGTFAGRVRRGGARQAGRRAR